MVKSILDIALITIFILISFSNQENTGLFRRKRQGKFKIMKYCHFGCYNLSILNGRYSL